MVAGLQAISGLVSVFTPVSQAELETFLQQFPVGKLRHYEGIAAGIENTNFFVTTDRGEYVLTLFEHHGHDELPFFINLMAWMAEHDIPSAHPIADHHGDYLHTLNDKPAVLAVRLHGESPVHPGPAQCRALGVMLGRMHIAGQGYPESRENPRGAQWRQETGQKLLPRLSGEAATLLADELVYQQAHDLSTLPQGIIHADLFRDNVLFENNHVSGLIDFYYACNDALLYDLAVTVNDWCHEESGRLDPARLQPMLEGYQSVRPLTGEERENWSATLRAAALRFWLSRLYDQTFPRPGEMTHQKNPEVFQAILQQAVDNPPEIPA